MYQTPHCRGPFLFIDTSNCKQDIKLPSIHKFTLINYVVYSFNSSYLAMYVSETVV